jgi:hypothetical protein
MAQPEIAIVLMRQLASTLAVPILIVDRERDLLFFNESAEPILGAVSMRPGRSCVASGQTCSGRPT